MSQQHTDLHTTRCCTQTGATKQGMRFFQIKASSTLPARLPTHPPRPTPRATHPHFTRPPDLAHMRAVVSPLRPPPTTHTSAVVCSCSEGRVWDSSFWCQQLEEVPVTEG